MAFLVNIISGLLLFEFGYKINLRWIWNNPIILITGFVESAITFSVIFTLSRLFGISMLVSLEFASLFMATSPFVIMHIINQQQSSGQVTERTLHLSALNCIFAIFMFKLILGLMVFQESGNLWQAIRASIIMTVFSATLGIIFTVFLSTLTKRIKPIAQERTVALALIIILMVGVAKALGFSPIITALTFGLASRHIKIAMDQQQRNFGALENILIVALFMAIPLNLDWHNFSLFIGLGVALFFGRFFTKIIVVAFFSYYSGISFYKSILTGIALTPIAVFSILLLDQGLATELALSQELLYVSGLIFFLELIGPCITQYALIKAGENGPD